MFVGPCKLKILRHDVPCANLRADSFASFALIESSLLSAGASHFDLCWCVMLLLSDFDAIQ